MKSKKIEQTRPALLRRQCNQTQVSKSRQFELQNDVIGLTVSHMTGLRHRDLGFTLIAIFKILKAVVLLVVGFGMLSLLRGDINETVNQWAQALQLNKQNYLIQNLLIKLGMVKRRQWGLIVGTTFFYAALLGTEGVGLLLQKVWAEYLTIVVTVSFIPFEVHGLVKHPTPARVIILALNVLIAVYLIVRLRQQSKSKRSSSSSRTNAQ